MCNFILLPFFFYELLIFLFPVAVFNSFLSVKHVFINILLYFICLCWYSLVVQCTPHSVPCESYTVISNFGVSIVFCVKKQLVDFFVQPWQWGIPAGCGLWQSLCCPRSDSELCAGSLAAPGSSSPSHHSSGGTEQQVTHPSLRSLAQESCGSTEITRWHYYVFWKLKKLSL